MTKTARIISAALMLFTYLIASKPVVAEAATPRTIDAETVPGDIQGYCDDAGMEFNFPSEILVGVVFQETSFTNVNSVSDGVTYYGSTQINPRYFQQQLIDLGLNVSDLEDPKQNIRVCAYTLSQYMEKYDNDMLLVLECWNEGEPTAVATHTRIGSEYARNVVRNANILLDYRML